MATLRQNPSGKYNAIVQRYDATTRKQKQKRVNLLTTDLITAKKRLRIVKGFEDEIKAGENVSFAWQNEEGRNQIIEERLTTAIDGFLNFQENVKGVRR